MNLGRPALILMVDDTPANLSVLSDLLSARGFKISVAEDGESALEQLQYVQPDLILLDAKPPSSVPLTGITDFPAWDHRNGTQSLARRA